MTTTPLPPHAIAVDHPNFPERHWTGFELAWIAARDKQFLAHSKQARADLEAENARLREALQDIADDYADRFNLESPSTNPGIKHVIKQARAALENKT